MNPLSLPVQQVQPVTCPVFFHASCMLSGFFSLAYSSDVQNLSLTASPLQPCLEKHTHNQHGARSLSALFQVELHPLIDETVHFTLSVDLPPLMDEAVHFTLSVDLLPRFSLHPHSKTQNRHMQSPLLCYLGA